MASNIIEIPSASTATVTTSPAMEYFTLMDDGKRKCKLCADQNKMKIYAVTTSTHNLYNHLESIHRVDLRKPAEMAIVLESQRSLTEADKMEITEAYIKWIVTDLQPFTTSSSKEFKYFVYKLNPEYNVPCCQILKKLIIEHYTSQKIIISNILRSISGAISLTTDIWTSTAMDSYCAATAHYIDENWRIRHIVLDVIPMSYPHTAEVIKDLLMTIIEDFGIEEKVLALTTDNASSMVKAFSLLEMEMCTKYNRAIFHIRCSAHVINLAVQEGLQCFFESDTIIM